MVLGKSFGAWGVVDEPVGASLLVGGLFPANLCDVARLNMRAMGFSHLDLNMPAVGVAGLWGLLGVLGIA